MPEPLTTENTVISHNNLTPEQILKELENNSTLLIIPDLVSLESNLVHQIKNIESREKSLILAINGPSPVQSAEDKLTVLSHLEGVHQGCIISSSNRLWENPEIRFHQNTRLLSNTALEKNSFRQTRPHSPYQEKAETSDIKNPKYIPVNSLPALTEQYRQEGKKVVFISGVFDILHIGHLKYFQEAKSKGDILIILTNSDHSANLQPKNIYGDRPINSIADRIDVLSIFDVVNHVSTFDEPNLLNLLPQMKNIVYVKTQKDLNNPTVKQETEIVLENNGEVFIASAIKNPQTADFFSSTQNLDVARSVITESDPGQKTSPEITKQARAFIKDYFHTDFATLSPLYDEQIDKILTKLLTLNASQGILTTWREQIAQSLELPIPETTAAQTEIINNLISFFRTNSDEIGYQFGSTQSSVLIHSALKIIGFEPDLLPIQYTQKETSFGMIISVKLADGRIQFIDPAKNTIHPPLDFFSKFFKLLPAHKNFELKPDLKYFAKRIYYYPELLRQTAIALNVLSELNPQTNDINMEVVNLVRPIWAEFGLRLNSDQQVPDFIPPQQTETTKTIRYPSIVAHGGVSVLKTPIGGAENSKPGIEYALTKGSIDVLEIDIVPSADGQWILSHHVDLKNLTEKKGNTTDYTYDELLKTRFKNTSGQPLDITLIGLPEALSLIKKHKTEAIQPFLVKVDVKHHGSGSLIKIIDSIKSSGLPLEKIILTAGEQPIVQALHQLEPSLRFELNTVEPINYLMAYRLMKNDLTVNLFLEYVKHYSQQINAVTVSLMQVAMNTWGNDIFRKLVQGIHSFGLQTQVWVARNIKEYQKDALIGVDHVLMHNSQLIKECHQLREKGLQPPTTSASTT